MLTRFPERGLTRPGPCTVEIKVAVVPQPVGAEQPAKATPLTLVPGEKSAPPEPFANRCHTKLPPVMSGSSVSD